MDRGDAVLAVCVCVCVCVSGEKRIWDVQSRSCGCEGGGGGVGRGLKGVTSPRSLRNREERGAHARSGGTLFGVNM